MAFTRDWRGSRRITNRERKNPTVEKKSKKQQQLDKYLDLKKCIIESYFLIFESARRAELLVSELCGIGKEALDGGFVEE
jgi:hypothetical protein